MTAAPLDPTPRPDPERQPEPGGHPPERPEMPGERPTLPRRFVAWVAAAGWTHLVAWTVAVGAFALFALFGSVPTEAGANAGTGVGVVEAWRALGRDLPSVGHATLLRLAYYGALALLVLGGAVGLWLALAVEPAPPEDEPPDGAGSA